MSFSHKPRPLNARSLRSLGFPKSPPPLKNPRSASDLWSLKLHSLLHSPGIDPTRNPTKSSPFVGFSNGLRGFLSLRYSRSSRGRRHAKSPTGQLADNNSSRRILKCWSLAICIFLCFAYVDFLPTDFVTFALLLAIFYMTARLIARNC